MMRWPWSKPEKRQSGGSFSDAVVRLLEAQAAGTAADASSTAAVEAASGALSRAFAAAEVSGPSYVQGAVRPTFLSQVGRDLVRRGDSMHVITVSPMGKLSLLPCSSWHFEGDADPETWTSGPRFTGLPLARPGMSHIPALCSSSGARHREHPIPASGRCRGRTPRRGCNRKPNGVWPTKRADLSRNLLAVPQDGGDDEADDPLKSLKADIRTARGKALLVETTSAGFGEGRSAAPQRDWMPSRLGAGTAGRRWRWYRSKVLSMYILASLWNV